MASTMHGGGPQREGGVDGAEANTSTANGAVSKPKL